jgi:hypothetical protein
MKKSFSIERTSLSPCGARSSSSRHGARGTALRRGWWLRSGGHRRASFNSEYRQLLEVGVGVYQRSEVRDRDKWGRHDDGISLPRVRTRDGVPEDPLVGCQLRRPARWGRRHLVIPRRTQFAGCRQKGLDGQQIFRAPPRMLGLPLGELLPNPRRSAALPRPAPRSHCSISSAGREGWGEGRDCDPRSSIPAAR